MQKLKGWKLNQSCNETEGHRRYGNAFLKPEIIEFCFVGGWNSPIDEIFDSWTWNSLAAMGWVVAVAIARAKINPDAVHPFSPLFSMITALKPPKEIPFSSFLT